MKSRNYLFATGLILFATVGATVASHLPHVKEIYGGYSPLVFLAAYEFIGAIYCLLLLAELFQVPISRAVTWGFRGIIGVLICSTIIKEALQGHHVTFSEYWDALSLGFLALCGEFTVFLAVKIHRSMSSGQLQSNAAKAEEKKNVAFKESLRNTSNSSYRAVRKLIKFLSSL